MGNELRPRRPSLAAFDLVVAFAALTPVLTLLLSTSDAWVEHIEASYACSEYHYNYGAHGLLALIELALLSPFFAVLLRRHTSDDELEAFTGEDMRGTFARRVPQNIMLAIVYRVLLLLGCQLIGLRHSGATFAIFYASASALLVFYAGARVRPYVAERAREPDPTVF